MVASWYIRRDLDGTLVLDDRIHRMPAAGRTAVARISRRAGAWQTLSETHLTYTRLEWRPPITYSRTIGMLLASPRIR